MHTAKMKAGIDYKKTMYTYLQGRFFSPLDPHDSEYNIRFILDLYFSASVTEHIKLKFSVDNITGKTDSLGPATAQLFSLGIQYSL